MKLFLFLIFTMTNVVIFAQQNITSSFEHQDSIREFKTYVPQLYLDNPNEAVPLLLNLHGYGSINWQQEVYGDFRSIADEENFIICHPNGTLDATGTRFWNVGFTPSNIDDVSFLSALIDSLSKTYNIDSNKIFSTGMSNGGFMSYKLACELPGKIKAIASVTGSMVPNQITNCTNMNAIPTMQIHGTSDPTVPYNGNTIMEPVEEVVGFWVSHNGCDSLSIETNVPNINTSDNSTAVRYDFNQNCDENASVVFYKVENGGHTWPGASFLIPGAITNLDFNASEVIWKFFCPDSDFTSVKALKNINLDVKIYPNPSQENILIILTENEEIINVQLYNNSGKMISSHTERLINFSKLDKGICYLKIETNKGLINKKFIKL